MKNKTLPWRVYVRVVQSYRFILIYVLFHCVTPGVIYTYDDVVNNQLILHSKHLMQNLQTIKLWISAFKFEETCNIFFGLAFLSYFILLLIVKFLLFSHDSQTCMCKKVPN